VLEKFTSYFNSEFPESGNINFYLAISGGKDSMALSHLLVQSGIKHNLLHCNFKLRGHESDEDEQFVKAHAEKYQLKCITKSFDTVSESDKRGDNIQITARNLRYEWFNQIMSEGATNILLTAHHRDDSIETFFINLLRGTGIKGLSGIPTRNGQIYRPLINFELSEIFKFIEEHNIDYRQDSSNSQNKYLRNKIRHSLIPLIEELSPEFRKKFTALFAEQNELDSFLKEEIKNTIYPHLIDHKNYLGISIDSINDSFLAKLFLKEYGIHRSRTEEFFKFTQSTTGSIFQSSSHTFLKDREQILFKPKGTPTKGKEKTIELSELPITVNNWRLSTQDVNMNELKDNPKLFLDLEKLSFPIKMRPWENSDRIIPFGMNGSKLVSDILIDKKYNRFQKDELMVISDSENRLIAIPGMMISNQVRISKDSTQSVVLSK
jgi:tRNA(Ile)-lysidine synthase